MGVINIAMQKLIFYVFFVYIMVALLALLYVWEVHWLPSSIPIQAQVPTYVQTGQSLSSILIKIIVYGLIVFIGAIVIRHFAKHFKKPHFEKFMRFYIVFVYAVSLGFIFYIFYQPVNIFAPLFWQGVFIFGWMGAALVFLYLLIKKSNKYYNFFAILFGVGNGLIIGANLPPWAFVALFLIISVYDYIAVIKSNVMGSLVKTIFDMESPPPMAIISGSISDIKQKVDTLQGKPDELKLTCKNCGYVYDADIARLGGICPVCNRHIVLEKLKDGRYRTKHIIFEGLSREIYQKSPIWMAYTIEKQKAPSVSLIGLGDIVIPAGFIASVIFFGVGSWILALAGACLGWGANLYWLRTRGRGIPAIPFLFVCMVGLWGLGLGVAMITT